MLPKEKIIVGLEVGTSKVCAVVGEVLDDGNIMVIGVGRANSEGVRKGEIVNIDAAVERIHAAVADDEREISEEEVRSVLLNAKAVNIPMDHVVIHAIRQHFFVDGHDGIQNPVGMIGAKLEADVHVIYGVRTRLQNTIKCIKHVPLDVANIAVAGFASALAVLTSEHQQLGAVVIDMGGGTTDYLVYSSGTIQHSGVIAVGGDHITNDVAIGLR